MHCDVLTAVVSVQSPCDTSLLIQPSPWDVKPITNYESLNAYYKMFIYEVKWYSGKLLEIKLHKFSHNSISMQKQTDDDSCTMRIMANALEWINVYC